MTHRAPNGEGLRVEPSLAFGDVNPLTWAEIRRILGTVARTIGEEKIHVRHRTTSVHLRPNSWSLTLAVPIWTGELLGADVRSQPWFTTAIEAQAFVSAYVKAADDLLDQDRSPAEPSIDVVPKLLPLLGEANLRILGVRRVPPAVVRQYHRLLAEQHDASAWELRARLRPERQLSAGVLRRLAAKAAILKWPAFFVPLWLGRPSSAGTRIAATLEQTFLVMQLLDDVVDFSRDAFNRQPNAVLIAAGHPSPHDRLRFWTLARRSIPRILELARRRAEQLERRAPPRTHFQKLCKLLVQAVDELERAAGETSSLQILNAVLETMAASVAAPERNGTRRLSPAGAGASTAERRSAGRHAANASSGRPSTQPVRYPET